ncbi:hypothetical protein RFF05_05240 [Bengtsoniella intestinalis]|uniref:hypothetical protein n=1 Tax=Bengtsoniella intestinalis TaxID=3073143 RepID=UPI00391F01AF
MKHTPNSIGAFLLGLAIGGLTLGGSVAYASGIVATLSTQPIFVDGEQVEMTAYTINGNNYVKLRDVGQAVGFNVSWNFDESRVDIDSNSPYFADDADVVVEEITVPQTVADMVTQVFVQSDDEKAVYRIRVDNGTNAGLLSTGQEATVNNIVSMLDQFEALYPNGTSWGDNTNSGDIYWYDRNLDATIGGAFGCNSYTYALRDVLYGRECEAIYTHNDLSQVRVGDVVFLWNDSTKQGHWIVISEIGENSAGTYFKTMSGNANGKVSTDAPYYTEANMVWYPDSTVYCFY